MRVLRRQLKAYKMATPTPQEPTVGDLVVKALEQICYNTTGLDVTIGQIKDLMKAPAPVQVPASQPVVDSPTANPANNVP